MYKIIYLDREYPLMPQLPTEPTFNLVKTKEHVPLQIDLLTCGISSAECGFISSEQARSGIGLGVSPEGECATLTKSPTGCVRHYTAATKNARSAGSSRLTETTCIKIKSVS